MLNKVTLTGISNDECKKIYGRRKIIDSIICVKSGSHANDGAGTCQVRKMQGCVNHTLCMIGTCPSCILEARHLAR